mgnify:FL=1
MKKVLIIFSAISLLFSQTPALAATTLTLDISHDGMQNEPLVSLSGELNPPRAGTKVSIEVQLKGSWHKTHLATRTKSGGVWNIDATATALIAKARYRAVAKIGVLQIKSPSKVLHVDVSSAISNIPADQLVSLSGPGGRIHGADISRWQHPGGKKIDFVKMYNAGIRFVMIKSSDTRDESDLEARKHMPVDRAAAQAAGLYTGFYHYTTLPNTTDPAAVIADAQTQAQKAIWRLASVGGYSERDLPYALDLESNCVVPTRTGCAKYTSKKLITLFATTWLKTVAEKTGRQPILYSYSKFLESAMIRNSELKNYPLWIAHYSINPADPLAQPGTKVAGCFVHSWTTSKCESDWLVWQYTSCGIGKKYGVPSARLDLNVFRGTPETFIALTKGTWTPQPIDQMPVNEPTTFSLKNLIATDSDKPVYFEVSVLRPTGLPVVTGTVEFKFDPLTIEKPVLAQTAVRAKSGDWKLKVSGLPAGTWNGFVNFKDDSNTHADNSVPVTLNILPGSKPTPTIKPKPKPGVKSSFDGCRGQIIN